MKFVFMLRLALYQPEIPQNTGTLLRLGACLGVGIDIIEPCGFGLNDQKLHRAGMDYVEIANYQKHASWQEFYCLAQNRRLIYLTPHSSCKYTDIRYNANDTLLLGRESDGIPETIAQTLLHQVTIPMQAGRRSLNVAVAGAMVLGEALRQLQWKEQSND
jgi:Predicted rRNA methylase (SpoU class)